MSAEYTNDLVAKWVADYRKNELSDREVTAHALAHVMMALSLLMHLEVSDPHGAILVMVDRLRKQTRAS